MSADLDMDRSPYLLVIQETMFQTANLRRTTFEFHPLSGLSKRPGNRASLDAPGPDPRAKREPRPSFEGAAELVTLLARVYYTTVISRAVIKTWICRKYLRILYLRVRFCPKEGPGIRT